LLLEHGQSSDKENNTAISSWLTNLPAVLGDGYLRLGAGHFGADRLAALTALRQLWSSCVLMIQALPSTATEATEAQGRLEQLLVGLYDSLARCQLQFDAREMLEPLADRLSPATRGAFERKIGDNRLVPAAS